MLGMWEVAEAGLAQVCMEDEQASNGTREEARQNLVMLHTITKPASPTTPEDNAAVRERVIDFLVRTLGHNSI
jgi:hypothetical protein